MFVLDLTHLHIPGSEYNEFDSLSAAIEMAYGFSLPGNPVRIFRDSIASGDVAAVAHADGGVDHYR